MSVRSVTGSQAAISVLEEERKLEAALTEKKLLQDATLEVAAASRVA